MERRKYCSLARGQMGPPPRPHRTTDRPLQLCCYHCLDPSCSVIFKHNETEGLNTKSQDWFGQHGKYRRARAASEGACSFVAHRGATPQGCWQTCAHGYRARQGRCSDPKQPLLSRSAACSGGFLGTRRRRIGRLEVRLGLCQQVLNLARPQLAVLHREGLICRQAART